MNHVYSLNTYGGLPEGHNDLSSYMLKDPLIGKHYVYKMVWIYCWAQICRPFEC